MGDGDSKLDANKRTGDLPSEAQATCVQTTHGHLPAPPALEPLASRAADDTRPTSRIQLKARLAPDPIGPIAHDPIAALQRQLEELRSLCEEQQSVQRLWNASSEERSASLAERVGKLEVSGKAVAETDVVISYSPDGREAMEDNNKLEAVAETDPDASVDNADTAELVRTWDLEESMWDSALFLGRPDVGMDRVVTLWAVLVLLLNMLLQTTIAVIVVLNMGDPTFAAKVVQDLWYALQPRCRGMACSLLSFPQVRQPQAVGVTGRSSVGFC
jgi:hypothetical protein